MRSSFWKADRRGEEWVTQPYSVSQNNRETDSGVHIHIHNKIKWTPTKIKGIWGLERWVSSWKLGSQAGLEFSCQHPCYETHNLFYLQFQCIYCSLLASLCRHTNKQRNERMNDFQGGWLLGRKMCFTFIRKSISRRLNYHIVYFKLIW